MRFLLVHLFRRRSIFDKEKIPLRQGQNYRTFAKIAKILLKKNFLKKSKNTIDKRLAAVYNTAKQLNKYSNVQKNRRRGGCPSGKVI